MRSNPGTGTARAKTYGRALVSWTSSCGLPSSGTVGARRRWESKCPQKPSDAHTLSRISVPMSVVKLT
eukprot:8324923-Lingulodinium_polyedra.AAC.1